MNNVYVIEELEHDSREKYTIGVSSSIKKAQEMIDKYYGEHKELSFKDVRDSGIEWEKTLEVLNHLKQPYKVTITLFYFTVGSL